MSVGVLVLHTRDLDADRRIIINWILRKQGERVQTELTWLRIGYSDGLL
jgi:hypothetical protein